MSETEIYVPDLECESCEKVLRKALNIKGINNISFKSDKVLISHDESVALSSLLSAIKMKGYKASLEPIKKTKWHSHVGDMERLLLRHVAISFIVLLILEGIVAFIFKDAEWLKKYAIWLLLNAVVSVSIVAELFHLRSYRTTVTQMSGMMLGMILGMQSGMMIGFIIGATTNFFLGALIGSIVGVLFGFLAGSCCGSMGVVQGMMSGFMGGTMGPMISVMMAANGFWIFLPWFFIANLGMLWVFSVLLIENVVADRPGVEKSPISLLTFLSYTLVLSLVVLFTMIFGPTGSVIS
ncbi:MAG: cation transporter [Nanoarchaeota archaeon]